MQKKLYSGMPDKKGPKEFVCQNCGHKSQSKDQNAVICGKCKAWTKPGKNQSSLFT